ncbi:MAG: diguanylate cyclase [Proteobacteria bacterium]|nr:diguanylate cyclase [Pseudomonadota bacterium]
MRIVLAEPSRIGRAIVSAMLSEDGHEVITCDTAEGALHKVVEPDSDIDVLITAIEFPIMSGLELCWEARISMGQNPLHIIVLSSSRDEEKLAEALDSGADDFICKPPRKNELLARLRAASRLLIAQRELIRLANFDTLTGLRNRRSFFEEMEKCREAKATACVIMLDVDHFKQVNDRYGHDAGDDVLKEVGRRMSAIDRNFSRLGGEEFALLIRQPLHEAGGLAERMRREIETGPFKTCAGEIAVSASIGVAECPPGGHLEEALKQADVALYASKASGRNRVTLARPPDALNVSLSTGIEALHSAIEARIAIAGFSQAS